MQHQQNPELELAWQFIAGTGTHLFLTGRAGTGKTTFLRRLKAESPKRMVVLAPTGIAAINAGGVTLHSFFQLPFAPHLPDTSFTAAKNSAQAFRYRFSKEKISILRSIDLLVIDEISMVRADLLDAVDEVMRRYRDREKPFGGVQMLMIGDLQQLAPVVKDEEWQLLSRHYETPYFFSSHALSRTDYCTIELKTVYRQSDNTFLNLLNSIRENRAGRDVMDALNRRCLPDFRPRREEGYIRLVTHNAQARRINDSELERLPGRAYTFRATIDGKFPEYAYPTDLQLELKPGAQVMFVKNDTSGERRYYNGMLGEVTAISSEAIEVTPHGGGTPVSVGREEWSNARYVLDEESKEIREEVEGTFSQYPLKTAWAITIHKSQGLTFDRAIIDAGGSFAHGQTYVALSRCRTLEGLVLSTPLSARAIINDATVETFTREARHNAPDNARLTALQRDYFLQLLAELFDFLPLFLALNRYVRLIDEHLYRLYPKLLDSLKEEQKHVADAVVNVARKFAGQYTRLVGEAVSSDYRTDVRLQERLTAGSVYFGEQLKPLADLLKGGCPPTDNKLVKKKLAEAYDDLRFLLTVKTGLLKYVSAEGFATAAYLKRKALLTLDATSEKPTTKPLLKLTGKQATAKRTSVSTKASSGMQPGTQSAMPTDASSAIRSTPADTLLSLKSNRKRDTSEPPLSVPADVLHPDLYNRLVAWRNAEAARLGLPVYTVIQQKALLGISNLLPTDRATLLRIPYLGKKSVDKYGDVILDMVRHYRQDSLRFDE